MNDDAIKSIAEKLSEENVSRMKRKTIQFSGKNLLTLYSILVYAKEGIHCEIGNCPDFDYIELDEIENLLKKIDKYIDRLTTMLEVDDET